MAKAIREKIKLGSSAGTGHYYTTTKNKRTKPDKLELKKYDPVVRKHVAYKEAKISRPPSRPENPAAPGFFWPAGRKGGLCTNRRFLHK